MRYISTNFQSPAVTLEEAINKCMASDGGMFMPERIPAIPKAFFNNIGQMSLRDIAYVVSTVFLGDDIDAAELKNIVDESFSYDAPMRLIDRNIFIFELFHGPTLTFKDYGARFMARLMRALDGRSSRQRNVLVATTGNTGAATANGLFKFDGIRVSVLYPRGTLTKTQMSQLTSLGGNIYPVEIAGSVEDCKRLVQMAIADPALSELNLTGGNSINIARLIPQVSFAFYAYAHLRTLEVPGAENAVYCIPSGNMSNVVAAAMAKRLGLPMGFIVAATAANNQVAPMLSGGTIASDKKPVKTMASSIDMSIPSGWPRLVSLYGGDLNAINHDVKASAPVSDETIRDTIDLLRKKHAYTIDAHGAVAFKAASDLDCDCPRVVYATGHPAKQLDIIKLLSGKSADLPWQLKDLLTVRRPPVILPPTLPALRKYMNSIQ